MSLIAMLALKHESKCIATLASSQTSCGNHNLFVCKVFSSYSRRKDIGRVNAAQKHVFLAAINDLLDDPLFIKSHKLRNDNTDDKLKEKISRIRDIK